MSFGERLRELREDKNMTQKDLGNLLGVSGRQAGNYESNKQFVRDEESMLKIIKFFDVSADYLMGLSNERNYRELFKDFEEYAKLPPSLREKLNDYKNFLKSNENT